MATTTHRWIPPYRVEHDSPTESHGIDTCRRCGVERRWSLDGNHRHEEYYSVRQSTALL